MMSLPKRTASLMVAIGLASIGSLGWFAPASANELPCASYGTPAQSDTDIVVSSGGNVSPGDTFTATATVSVDGQPAPAGEVVFNYRGQKYRADVVGGSATSGDFTAKPGNNQDVRANYRGSCTDGSTAIAASGGASILGVEAFAGGNGGNGGPGSPGNNAGGGVVAGVSTLAATGISPSAQLIGLTGSALVVAGAATLMIRRRRVTM